MKKIVLTLALLLGVYSAQAWNWIYDQATLLLAFENLTPQAQAEPNSDLRGGSQEG